MQALYCCQIIQTFIRGNRINTQGLVHVHVFHVHIMLSRFHIVFHHDSLTYHILLGIHKTSCIIDQSFPFQQYQVATSQLTTVKQTDTVI